MALDIATVRRVAALCRLRVSDTDLSTMEAELNDILHWVEKLTELDTDDVLPMTRVVDVDLPMRDDVVSDCDCADKILVNAPVSAQGFFSVPKVFE